MKKVIGGCVFIFMLMVVGWTTFAYVIAYLWNEYVADAVGGPHLPFKIVLIIVVVLFLITGNGPKISVSKRYS